MRYKSSDNHFPTILPLIQPNASCMLWCRWISIRMALKSKHYMTQRIRHFVFFCVNWNYETINEIISCWELSGWLMIPDFSHLHVASCDYLHNVMSRLHIITLSWTKSCKNREIMYALSITNILKSRALQVSSPGCWHQVTMFVFTAQTKPTTLLNQ